MRSPSRLTSHSSRSRGLNVRVKKMGLRRCGQTKQLCQTSASLLHARYFWYRSSKSCRGGRLTVGCIEWDLGRLLRNAPEPLDPIRQRFGSDQTQPHWPHPDLSRLSSRLRIGREAVIKPARLNLRKVSCDSQIHPLCSSWVVPT